MGGWHNPQLAELVKVTKEANKPPKFSILKMLGLGFWGIITLAIGAYLGAYFNAKFTETKQLTIPTTVVDKYGNKLHLEEPVAHKGYYEYPIIIYDKMNNYRRIDKYAFGKELGIKFDGE